MRRLLQENMFPALWIAFALYWVLAAVCQRRAKQDESFMARLFYVLLAAIAFLFLLDKKDRSCFVSGFLRRHLRCEPPT